MMKIFHMKKVVSDIKNRVKRNHKSNSTTVSEKALSNFETAANFIIERHKDTIKELEKC